MKASRFLPHALAAAVAAPITPLALAAELEEVTVTAQKRSQRLTEVPIAITSFGAENIEETGIRQLREVAEFIPNLSISSGKDFDSTVSIRGVGANSRNIGFDTRVGVYLDGVYLGQSPALNQELLDLERIEVLRGPQGTLFGKNTVAGAINLISRQPGNTLEGGINIEYGNFNTRQMSASLSAPLSDSLFAKVALSSQQRDGIQDNLLTGNALNEQDGDAYRAQLVYDAGGNFTANLAIDGTDAERLTYVGEPVTDTFGMTPDTAAPQDDTVAMNHDPLEAREIRGSALTMNWDLASGFAIKSITAVRDTEIFYRNDVDYAPLDLAELRYEDSYNQVTQEFQLVSPESEDLQYVAGLYLYQQEGDSLRQIVSTPTAAMLFGTNPEVPVTTDGTVDTSSFAAFMNGSYRLTSQWKLGFGFRYSEEEKDVDWRIDGSGSGAFAMGTGSVDDRRTDSHFSPNVVLNYDFTPYIHGYAKYAGGFKSGGYNLDFIGQSDLNAGIDFDKETVDSVEIGLKGTALNRSLSFNLAAFQSDYTDYQVNQFIDLGEGRTSISIRNAAEVETRGLEAEFTYNANDYLQLNAAFGLLDAEFADYPGGGAGGADVSGNKLPGASDYTVNLGAQYRYPIMSMGVEFMARVDYSFRDDYYNTADNEQYRTLMSGDVVQYGWVDDIELVNARIGVISDSESWSASLWARNLLDEEYLTDTSRDFFGTLTHFKGMPRTYGLEVGYRF
ncbi:MULTISPECIES: TonB-dependent receptor [Microbulbifer]|uniref:TonB-dependent receptor n=1 Tax=Microbulbifer celer TaxID=435905 RepID=A0ABW3UEL2_9GAMM|nr:MULTISPECIES: TonB-dependent receptor [Microbulbifer]UFN56018.1 TonB-dependent receptor [Microbulbifer celer]